MYGGKLQYLVSEIKVKGSDIWDCLCEEVRWLYEVNALQLSAGEYALLYYQR